jgi:hypothetical protein
MQFPLQSLQLSFEDQQLPAFFYNWYHIGIVNLFIA